MASVVIGQTGNGCPRLAELYAQLLAGSDNNPNFEHVRPYFFGLSVKAELSGRPLSADFAGTTGNRQHQAFSAI